MKQLSWAINYVPGGEGVPGRQGASTGQGGGQVCPIGSTATIDGGPDDL